MRKDIFTAEDTEVLQRNAEFLLRDLCENLRVLCG
jgi:hypothetical protein